MMNETLHGNNNQLHRPGLYEVVICLISYVLIVAIGAQVINSFGQSNIVFYGLSYSALSALSGIGAFLAAYSIRLRTKVPFGIRPISKRWLMIGVGFGVIVFILARGGRCYTHYWAALSLMSKNLIMQLLQVGHFLLAFNLY